MAKSGIHNAMVVYTVRCEFTDESVLSRWCEWLEQTHLQEVLDAGADRAELVRLDGETVCEARYTFVDQAAFDAYQQKHGPRLRDDGLARFPLSLGLQYSRWTGQLLAAR